MKRVLVTGASGFIGRQTLPLLLSRGYDVHGVSSSHICDGVTWHRADLCNKSDISALVSAVKPTYLLHFAWITLPGIYWESPENEQWKNASRHLFAECAAHGGKRIVGAGTCAEYDWSNGEHLSEDVTPLNPKTVYGTAKRDLQHDLNALSSQNNMSSSWGRIFYLYGPHEHQSRLVSSVICSLLQGKAAKCTAGTQVRDFLYVKDVADAFVTLLESEVTGPVNIASGKPVAVKDIINTIARSLDREDLIEWGARPTPKDDPPILTADITKLRDTLQWQPHYTLDEGLVESIQWWTEHSAQPVSS